MTREEFNSLSTEEKRAKREEFWLLIKDGLVENEDATMALKIIRPSLYGTKRTPGAGRQSKYILFSNLFENEGNGISELDMFKELKIGRSECRHLIKETIKRTKPVEKRKWITFNTENETYELIEIGSEAPKNWTGYIPIESISLDDELL